MKVLNTSDWHFNDKDHDEILKCCEFILEKAKEMKPDVIIHSGDITHSKSLGLDTRSARSIFSLISRFREIAPVAIIIGTHSHDGNAALALSSTSGKYPIHVSEYPEQLGFRKDCGDNGLWFYLDDNETDEYYENIDFIISQIPQPTKKYFVNNLSIENSDKAIQNAMEIMFAGFGQGSKKLVCPHIVNMHIQVGGCYISETQQLIGRDIEVSKSQLKMLNADLICLGHIHKSQVIDDNAFYPGSPTRMNFGETEEKGFYIHKIEPYGCARATFDIVPVYYNESKFIETPARKMLQIKHDFTHKGSIHEDRDMVLYTYSREELENAHIKVSLTIWQDESKYISEQDIREVYAGMGAKSVIFSISHKPRETVRSEKVCQANSLPDKLSAMAELRAEEIKDTVLEKSNQLETGVMVYEEKYKEIIECK